jgi:hypothetical protein
MFRTPDSEIRQQQEGWHWGSDSSGSRKRIFVLYIGLCLRVSGCTEGVQRGADEVKQKQEGWHWG